QSLLTPPTSPPPTASSPSSLHDALPIFRPGAGDPPLCRRGRRTRGGRGDERNAAHPLGAGLHHRTQSQGLHLADVPRAEPPGHRDRKSTRLNSSHVSISYAVFCLKKKNK